MTHVIAVSDLWNNSMLPEGILDRWLVDDGASVKQGDSLAVLQIEGSRHVLTAPADGRLTIACLRNSVVEPGSIIGQVR